MELLPDCRLKRPVGQRPLDGWGAWIPIYCANCGQEGGRVPEETTTFAFWLCQACFETYGPIAATMVVPDEVFWAQIEAERPARATKED